MKKHTKILATVGPASESIEVLEAMIKAGANLFRLNFSHGTHEHHAVVLGNIREAARRTDRIIGVLQDISGPKVRIGELKEPVELKIGDRIEFLRYDDVIGERNAAGVLRLSLNYPELLDLVKVGQAIYLYDGMIRTEVIEVGGTIVCEVQNNGKLASRKGVNFPNTPLGIDVLTPKDREDIAWGVEHGVDFMAISFVQHAKDMTDARALVKSLGGDQELIAKIEKFDAVEEIDEILAVSDGLMVARGDLGIEVPYYRVPLIQKALIAKANAASKPVITATQMLLSMTEKERATRAEISDVANAVLDGTDAVMLSEESAVGKYPVKAIETMVQTIREAETIYPYHRISYYEAFDEMDVIDESTVLLSQKINAAAILSMTGSGQSAKKLSRYRPLKPIYAITNDEAIARKLTLIWGVLPAFLAKSSSVRDMLIEVVHDGLERDVLKRDQMYIVTAGDPVGIPGTTNTIRILRRAEMDYYAETPLPQ